MDNTEISSKFPMPAFVTNDNQSSTTSLPEIFKQGNTLKAQSLGSPAFFVTIQKVQGDWILCDYLGDNEWKGVWIHVPSVPYLWAKVEKTA
jgi:hypothetical protein